jgi:hypothetical protein
MRGLAAGTVLLALSLPSPALADGGGGPGPSGGGAQPGGSGPSANGGGRGPSGGGGGREAQVRSAGTCGKGATSELRLKQGDAGVEVEFDARPGRGGPESWQVVLVQEGRVVWRARIRTRGGGGPLSARRTIRPLSGAERITARATGPGGITCVASAVLPG